MKKRKLQGIVLTRGRKDILLNYLRDFDSWGFLPVPLPKWDHFRVNDAMLWFFRCVWCWPYYFSSLSSTQRQFRVLLSAFSEPPSWMHYSTSWHLLLIPVGLDSSWMIDHPATPSFLSIACFWSSDLFLSNLICYGRCTYDSGRFRGNFICR